jgi:hypothetical protein
MTAVCASELFLFSGQVDVPSCLIHLQPIMLSCAGFAADSSRITRRWTLSDVGIIKGERVGRQVFYRFDPESLDDAFILLYAFRIGQRIVKAK